MLTTSRFKYSKGSFLNPSNVFLILAATFCVVAPGTHGGMCLKKGKMLMIVLSGRNRDVTPAAVSSASLTKRSSFRPGGYS